MRRIVTARGLRRSRLSPSFGTLGCLAVLFLFLVAGKLEAVPSSRWITKDQQEQIIQRLRTVLPQGWAITRTALNTTPDDWYTSDGRGFEVDGKNGEHSFQIWFLPKDWIGIRQPRANRIRLVYWEGILMGRDFKTITNTDQVPVQDALHGLDMQTPSLVNSGWYEAQKLFKDRMSEVDSRAQMLVRRFCKDRSCKDEAAYSLIVLGVPARSVVLDCAQHAKGDAQGFCVSALGYMGGQDSVRVLGVVISNPSTAPLIQKYAAMSLNSIADPSSGPALLKGLHVISWPEAEEQTAEALGRIRYTSAAPEILSRMQIEPHEARQQVYFARALASLQYQPAVATIQQLCKTTKFSGDWILKKQRDEYLGWVPEIALIRLTGSWGPPSKGIRLLLLPSEAPATPGQIGVVAVIENVGDRDLDILGRSGDLVVDGTRYQNKDSVIMDGSVTLRVNEVAARGIDLSGLIADGGVHRIQYQLGTANSNQLSLQVPLVNR